MSTHRNKTGEPVMCDTFLNRMMKSEKRSEPTKKISSLSKAASTVRAISPNSVNTHLTRKNVKQNNINPMIRHTSPYEESSVEIKLKTMKSKRCSETWGSCLKNNKTRDPYGFNNFDPLRLVHFLTKELKSHLQTLLPDDDCAQDMMEKLENALNRVPPEVASAIHLQQALDLIPKTRSRSNLDLYDDDQKPEKLETKKIVECKSVQTHEPNREDSDKIHKLFKENTEKLEGKIKEMEELIGKLRQENEQRKSKLCMEKDSVAYYKNRLEALEKNHTETVQTKINKMEEEKSALENQIGELKLQLASLNKPRDDLKKIIKELKKAKGDSDNENLKLKHQLKLSEIEKEKYMAVLAVRDRQINEIRTEMSQLQEVVNEQLMELHTNAFSNLPSNTGSDFLPDNKNVGDGTPSSFTTNDENYKQPEEIFKELQGGDMATIDDISESLINLTSRDNRHASVAEKDPNLYKSHSQTSVKDMLNELKRQAYSVNGGSLYEDKIN